MWTFQIPNPTLESNPQNLSDVFEADNRYCLRSFSVGCWSAVHGLVSIGFGEHRCGRRVTYLTHLFAFQNRETGSLMLVQNVLAIGGVIPELFVYCYFGEMISTSLTGVSDVVFTESAWYNCPPSLRGHLVMIIRESQKPCELKGFGLSILKCRMETFSMSIRTAISIFTVFKSTID